jgi:small-conductance mechanosensitive channel
MNRLVETYIEEIYLNEQLYAIAAKVQSNKHSISLALKSQDPKKIKAVLSGLPHLPIDKVHDLAAKHINGFNIEYAKAIKKVVGTPEERQIKAISISVLNALKKNSTVLDIKKALADYKTDPTYAFVFRDIFTGLCLVGLAVLAYMAGAGILSGIGAVLSAIGTGITVGGIGIGLIVIVLLFILATGSFAYVTTT